VRNLQITQCYCELSRAFAERTGGGPANWCTFATWASMQVGQTIRREDLTRTFERLFAESPEAVGGGDAAARGNRKVFEEIGREFARFLALSDLGSFPDGLRPGDPPDGQRYLRQAFASYAEAFRESDPRFAQS
jgi:hypothetical protein